MILITRPRQQSTEIKSLLDKEKFKSFHENLYNITYYKKKFSYNKNNYYIFTSINSVKGLIKNKQIIKFRGSRIFVVGEQVNKALSQAGCKNVIEVFEDSSLLLDFLKSKNLHKSSFIHLCGNIVNEDFFKKSKKYKIDIQRDIVYKTIPKIKFSIKLVKKIELNKITGIIFYSQLAANNFLRLSMQAKVMNHCKNINIYCISKRVAEPLRGKNFTNLHIAKNPNQNSLLQVIKKNYHFKKF